jgi:hypothetical protein
MAREVSLQTRMARNKLRTNLSLLSNASTRKAQQLREFNDKVQIQESNIFWVVTYILVISSILVLLGILFYVSR